MDYLLKVETTWYNIAGGVDGAGADAAKPDMANGGSILYFISTGTTQSAATSALFSPSSSTWCFFAAGSSAETFVVQSTASTVWCTAIAVRPGSSWQEYSGAARIYTYQTTTIPCHVPNFMPGKMLLREAYLTNLHAGCIAVTTTGYIGYPMRAKDMFANVHTVPNPGKDYAKMSDVTQYFSCLPYTASRCVSVNNLYFKPSEWLSDGISKMAVGNVNIDVNIQPGFNNGNSFQATVFIADNANGTNPAWSNTFYSNSDGSSDYAQSDVSFSTTASTVYLGISVTSNSNSNTLVVVYSSYTNNTTGRSVAVAVPMSAILSQPGGSIYIVSY